MGSSHGRLLCALFGVAACHGDVRAVASRDPARRGASVEAPRVARVEGPRVPIPAAQLRGERFVVSDERGTARLLAGPLRVEVLGDVPSVADDVTPWPIRHALRAARGWLFITTHAQVYASESFIGPLRPLRSFGCERPDDAPPNAAQRAARRITFPEVGVFMSEGRAVLRAPDGTLFTSDGATLVAETTPDVVAEAWGGAMGAMILGRNRLRFTYDRGATWHDVDLGGLAPIGLVGHERGVEVFTSAGWRMIDPDASLAESLHRPTIAYAYATDTTRTRALDGPLAGAYVTAASPPDACPAWRDPGVDWTPPHFVGLMPIRNGEVIAVAGSPAPFGTPRTRAFADTSAVPAIVSVTRPDHPQPGHRVTLAWRAEDDRGRYLGRAQTAAPVEVPVTSRWRLVAAARQGLLFAIDALPEGQTAVTPTATPDDDAPDTEAPEASRELFWFSSAGVRRISVGRVFDGGALRAINTDDGGVLVLALTDNGVDPRAPEPAPTPVVTDFALLVKLGPDGAEAARRTVIFAPDAQQLVGFGRESGHLGAVIADRLHANTYALHTLDGTVRPLGAWSFDGELPMCGARNPVGPLVHIVSGLGGRLDEEDVDALSVAVGPQADGPNFADARVVTFERAGANTCVRRVWGAQRLQSYNDADHDAAAAEDVGDRWGAVRLNAVGRALVGVCDTGARVSTVRARLAARIPFMQDL